MADGSSKKPIPAWVWIGCGCLLFPALGALVLAGLGFFGFSAFKGAIDRMADPEKREAAAIEKLGVAQVPPGWHVRTYFAVPFGFAMVVLGDGTPPPPPAGDSFEEKARSFENLDLGNIGDNRRMFIYLTLDSSSDESIEEILTGKRRGSSGMNLDLGVTFESERELSRGDLQVRGNRVAYVGKAGKLETNKGETYQVIYSELSFDCPDKGRRLGLLFETQPVEGSGAGSVADGAVLQSFLDPFNVCH